MLSWYLLRLLRLSIPQETRPSLVPKVPSMTSCHYSHPHSPAGQHCRGRCHSPRRAPAKAWGACAQSCVRLLVFLLAGCDGGAGVVVLPRPGGRASAFLTHPL